MQATIHLEARDATSHLLFLTRTNFPSSKQRQPTLLRLEWITLCLTISLSFQCTSPQTRTYSGSAYTLPPSIHCFSKAGSSWSFGLFLHSNKAALTASSLRFFNFCPCHFAHSPSDLTCPPLFPVNAYPSLPSRSIMMSPFLTPSQCDNPISWIEVPPYPQPFLPSAFSSFLPAYLTNTTCGRNWQPKPNRIWLLIWVLQPGDGHFKSYFPSRDTF